MNQITGAHLLPVMCPLAENECWLREESMSLPLCQPVRNPAQGNFRMSLCFGRLSSSSSPVILWSCQASCSLPHTLSTLMGLMREKTHSGLRQERPKYPIHLLRFPPAGPFLYPHLPAPSSRSTVRWQEVRKHSKFLPDTRRLIQQGPVLVSLHALSVVFL